MADISIIIPVYNTEKYIEECLEAVCHSTIFDICEVIIINDGSTDHSMNKIQKYIETYENIFVFSYENAGLSCARNRGVAQAKGKYVFFLDSDDYIKEDYIEKLYKAIQKEKCDIIFAGFTKVTDEYQDVEKRAILSTVSKPMSGCEYLERRMDAEDWLNQVWCAIYRREFLLEKSLFFDETVIVYEDILFTNYVLLYAERVSAIPEYGYMYRTRENSLVHAGMSKKDIDNLLKIVEKFMAIWKECNSMQKHVTGRMYYQLLSMLLYDIGEVNPLDKKMYYQKIKQSGVLKTLRKNCTCRKERLKFLIFHVRLQWYYPIIRMKERSLWKKKRK